MKMLFILSLACCLGACAENSGEKSESKENTKNQDIFPVTSFIAGQVSEVDSSKFHIVKYTTVDNNTNSSPISKEEFRRLANEFMQPDITGSSYKGLYKETSFADRSIPGVTLTYSTTKKDLEVQRMDVIIQKDALMNDKVQSIYMEKLSRENESSILKKLFWKVGNNFQIITSTKVGNNPATVSHLKVLWVNKD